MAAGSIRTGRPGGRLIRLFFNRGNALSALDRHEVARAAVTPAAADHGGDENAGDQGGPSSRAPKRLEQHNLLSKP